MMIKTDELMKCWRMDDEIFITSTRSKGDFAGVFEYDGETSYFYLYSLDNPDGEKIVGAIGLSQEITKDSGADLSVRWNKQETKVGVFFQNNLLALFNLDLRSKIGRFAGVTTPNLPNNEPFS